MKLEIGEVFETTKSGVVGTIQEIVVHPSGVIRLRLLVDGVDRWTSIRSENVPAE
jgi:hypothetical protein